MQNTRAPCAPSLSNNQFTVLRNNRPPLDDSLHEACGLEGRCGTSFHLVPRMMRSQLVLLCVLVQAAAASCDSLTLNKALCESHCMDICVDPAYGTQSNIFVIPVGTGPARNFPNDDSAPARLFHFLSQSVPCRNAKKPISFEQF